MTNRTITFTDKQEGTLTLEINVFDPRAEQCITCNDLTKLEARFEAWINSTPEFWYENIPAFQKWVDNTWNWLADMDNQVIAGDEPAA